MAAGWQPRLPPPVVDAIAHFPPALKQDVKQALRLLSTDPYAGEPLERELRGLRKYRARTFRIVYQIILDERLIHIVGIGHRQAIYDWVRQQYNPAALS